MFKEPDYFKFKTVSECFNTLLGGTKRVEQYQYDRDRNRRPTLSYVEKGVINKFIT